MWIGWNRELHAHGWVRMGPWRPSRNLRATLTVLHKHTAPFRHGDMFGQLWTASAQLTSQYPLLPTRCITLEIQTEKEPVALWKAEFILPTPDTCSCFLTDKQGTLSCFTGGTQRTRAADPRSQLMNGSKYFFPLLSSLFLPSSLLGTVFTTSLTNNLPRTCSAPSSTMSAKVMALKACPTFYIEIGCPRRKPCHSKPQSSPKCYSILKASWHLNWLTGSQLWHSTLCSCCQCDMWRDMDEVTRCKQRGTLVWDPQTGC